VKRVKSKDNIGWGTSQKERVRGGNLRSYETGRSWLKRNEGRGGELRAGY
jgi:hypothetical protein